MSNPVYGPLFIGLLRLVYLHSFVCVCTEIEAGTNQRPSATVLLNWQKSVARLTAYDDEEEGRRAACKTIDGQSEQRERERENKEVGSDFFRTYLECEC